MSGDNIRRHIVGGCCTGVKELISSPMGRTIIPPGCCPVLLLIPVHPPQCGLSRRPFCGFPAPRNNSSHIRTPSYPPALQWSGTVGLSRPENHFPCIYGLYFDIPGKIQVDIRLLVPLKPRKVSKGMSNPSFVRGCRRPDIPYPANRSPRFPRLP